jgi:hypothetical protein
MRNLLLLLALIFPAAAFAKRGPKTPEALGTALFKALKNQDQKAFVKLYMTYKDAEGILNESGMTREEKGRILLKMQQEPPELRAPAEYFKVQKKALDKGINWKNTKLLKVTADLDYEKGIQVARVTVYFVESVTGRQYTIITKECPKAPRGWRMVESVRLNTVSSESYTNENNYPYPDIQMQMDSMRMADSLMAVMYQHMMDTAMMEVPYEYAPEPDYCTLKLDSLRSALKLPAGQKCLKWMERADSTGFVFLVSKKPVKIIDAKGSSELTVAYSLGCRIELYVRNTGGGKFWIGGDSKILVTFADGSWVEMHSEMEGNPFGDVKLVFYAGEENGIRSQKLKSIKIQSKNGILERTLSPANSSELFEILNCLPK